MTARADLADRLNGRVADLVALFAAIERTRMAGVPVLNRALRVEAVGFELVAADAGDAVAGLGILITPWFMNLVRLPLQRHDDSAVGHTQMHQMNGRALEFIGAHEPAFGSFAACSLFSPVFEFSDQAAARNTALAVLALLRAQPAPPVVEPEATVAADASPARRSFLFGRSAAGVVRP
ncbi:MAG: [NiFe]-hydrogenase assembly chaperone HybE [Burkholderiaceae bacterium]|nr:[NiFe]-hydrogenase assembly chaperone HybE [Burkholderiaceae bacterium]